MRLSKNEFLLLKNLSEGLAEDSGFTTRQEYAATAAKLRKGGYIVGYLDSHSIITRGVEALTNRIRSKE